MKFRWGVIFCGMAPCRWPRPWGAGIVGCNVEVHNTVDRKVGIIAVWGNIRIHPRIAEEPDAAVTLSKSRGVRVNAGEMRSPFFGC